MIELIVYEYLKRALSVPVHMEKPNNPPDTYVLIEKTSSGGDKYVRSATLAVQSYADSMYNAAALNETVKETMLNAISEDSISRVELNSDYDYTDQYTKKYRYQAVFDVTHYSDY